MRSYILFRGIKWVCNHLILIRVRPERRKDIIRAFSEEQFKWESHEGGHDLSHDLIPIVRRPAALRETARRIFFRSTRRLHHAIQRNKCCSNNLAHALFSYDFLGAGCSMLT